MSNLPPHQDPLDQALRQAGARQRQRLTPPADAAPAPIAFPRPAATRPWRPVLAAAAALALAAGTWFALRTPPAPAPIAVAPPTVSPTDPALDPSLDQVGERITAALTPDWSALRSALGPVPGFTPPVPSAALTTLATTDLETPLANELDRLQNDVQRLFAEVPRIRLNWETVKESNPSSRADGDFPTPA